MTKIKVLLVLNNILVVLKGSQLQKMKKKKKKKKRFSIHVTAIQFIE